MDVPQAAGWYDDPDDPEQLRYFDGIVWSERRVPKRVERPQPTPAHPPVQGAAGPGAVPGPGRDVFGRPSGTAPGQHPQQYPGYEQYGHDSYAPPATAQTTADGQPLASYGLRVAAFFIDALVVTILNLLLSGWALVLAMRPYFSFVMEAVEANEPERLEGITPDQVMGLIDWPWYIAYMTISMLVFALYHTLLVGLKGGGVGKLVLGLQVRRVDRPGPPGIGTAFMRVLLWLALSLPLVSYLAIFVIIPDLLWPLKDDERQSFRDKIAKTQVVEQKRR